MTSRNTDIPKIKELYSKSRCKADVYRFVFKGYLSGWVIFTICDETGELSVQSDWGCWGHRWNTEHLGNGATLTEFIRDRDPEHADYLANKLSYCMPLDARELPDAAGTEEAIRSHILESRRSLEITKDEAAEAWEDTELFMGEYSEGGPAVAYWALPSSLNELLGADIYEGFFMTKEAPCLTVLRESLLPLLIRELKDIHESEQQRKAQGQEENQAGQEQEAPDLSTGSTV
jgi:hypothetical protein